jgi:ATP-binding cassette, subfamily C (CFTR/MRP), member 1
MATCSPAADNTFGPAVHGCRNDFDFTLLFEQSFFQLAPSALLLLTLPWRAAQLKTQNVKTFRTGSRTLKQTCIAILAGTQLALLVDWSVTPTYRTKVSIPAAVLSFLASLALLYLSSIEHMRSVRPSSLINAYMLFSLVLDVPQTRTLWLRPGPRSVPAIFSAAVGAKLVILYLEARSKRRSLFPPYRISAPESLVNMYDRTVLWWLNPLFWKGYRSILSPEKLDPIDSDMASSSVEAAFQASWKKRMSPWQCTKPS